MHASVRVWQRGDKPARRHAGRQHGLAPRQQRHSSCRACHRTHQAWVRGVHSRGPASHTAAAGRRAWVAGGAGRRRGAGRRHRGRAGAAGSHRAEAEAGTATGRRRWQTSLQRRFGGKTGGGQRARLQPSRLATLSAPVPVDSPAAEDSQAGSREEGSRRGCAPGCPDCLGSAQAHKNTQVGWVAAGAGGG